MPPGEEAKNHAMTNAGRLDPSPPMSPLPESIEGGGASDDESPSISMLRSALPMVALLVADSGLRNRLAALTHAMGLLAVGEDGVAAAAAVVTDAAGGVRKALAELRATARSDAAILVVLERAAPASELQGAFLGGAMLCVREPIDEELIVAAIGAAIGRRSSQAHSDDAASQQVQARLASLGRVTANFTHELNNPLAALVANFDVVREQLDSLAHLRDLMAATSRKGLDPEIAAAARPLLSRTMPGEDLRAAVADMAAALDRISGILTTVRRLTRGNVSSGLEDVDLASVATDARRWAAADLEGIDVEVLIDEPLVARADPRLLGQIMVNLVANAAHAAKQLPSPKVRLHVYRSHEAAIVSVRDNGPGVPAPIRDRIFEPFFTTRRGQGGTGLGLALCREYAAQMHARITLWTAPGRGACFRVHLQRGSR